MKALVLAETIDGQRALCAGARSIADEVVLAVVKGAPETGIADKAYDIELPAGEPVENAAAGVIALCSSSPLRATRSSLVCSLQAWALRSSPMSPLSMAMLSPTCTSVAWRRTSRRLTVRRSTPSLLPASTMQSPRVPTRSRPSLTRLPRSRSSWHQGGSAHRC